MIKPGEIFGNQSFFTSEKRETSLRSRNFSTVLEIKQKDFLKTVMKTPEDYERFIFIKEQIKLYSKFKEAKLDCLCCKRQNHLIKYCPLLHYVPDEDFLIKKLVYSHLQDRKPYDRKLKKKFNSRKDNFFIQSDILKLPSTIFEEISELLSEGTVEQQSSLLLSPLRLEPEKIEEEQEENRILDKEEEEDGLIKKNLEEIKENVVHSPMNKKNPTKFFSKEEITLEEKKNNLSINTGDNNVVNHKLARSVSNEQRIQILKKTSSQEIKNLHEKKGNIKEKKDSPFPVITIKEETKEKALEKESIHSFLNIFNFDFESIKEYKLYFPHNNYHNVIKRFSKTKKRDPSSSPSKIRIKKKIEKRMKASKLLVQSIKEIPKETQSLKKMNESISIFKNNCIDSKND